MAQTNNQKQQSFRKRRALLGQKRYEFYLTIAEKKKLTAYLKNLRDA